jgi:DNA-binding response OmpR family regulator
LIVEDDPSVRRMLEYVLADEGFAVATADSAERGLAAMGSSGFDVVVLDKNLPGMSGVDLLKRLREQDKQTGCLVITAYPSRESAERMAALGIDGFIKKPFDDVLAIGPRVTQVVELARRCPLHSSARHGSARPGRRRLLVGSADPQVTQLIGQAAPDQLELAFARNGVALAEQLDAGACQLVVIDGELPDCDLPGLLRKVTSTHPDLACFVLARRQSLHDLLGLIDMGVRGVLEPDVAPLELRDRLRLALPVD